MKESAEEAEVEAVKAAEKVEELKEEVALYSVPNSPSLARSRTKNSTN